jgi:hypothetical protein
LNKINYHVIDLKSFDNDPRKVIWYMHEMATIDLKYLETPTFQTIIDFKWKAFAKKLQMKQFWLMIAFTFCYFSDLIIGISADHSIEWIYA